MFVLVTGPESSGTRWVSTLCAAALGVEGHETWNGNEQIHDFTNAVMHRSLPHGTRTGFFEH